MAGIVACALDIPELHRAAGARGFDLVPIAPAALGDSGAQAAIIGFDGRDPAACVSMVRAHGWRGPLMLVLARGCGTSVEGALDAGADDAVALPACAGEIAARLAARLRCQPPRIALGGLRIDPVERRVERDGRTIALLPREYALLLHLARWADRCVGREELLASVWGLRFDPGTNVVEVHVSRLRAKLDRGFAVPMLRTDKGRGYRLTAG
ncbi:response regulator transcription factor [Sphingomonas sp. 7/4-4]|uniref:winged helix-turn-helix domain-containing protein n=1 Tax=Sphingomonas sp. 7/4-4 TaxID=3018446 RepID=UPI0022F39526|nr:response regulator transcription factor [Sphingomonas sp. 7/4-4]WBY06977.1 response regulator transcription factor [Sphingomonas sp. 7/4-4]